MIRTCVLALVLAIPACGGSPSPDSDEPAINRVAQPVGSDDEMQSRQIAAVPAKADNSPPAGTAAGGAEAAPNGNFYRTDGSSLTIKSTWKEKGAVIVFYRGQWCRQCRKQLEEFQEAIGEFRGRNFEVYAISTDSPDKSGELKAKLGLDYELLSDKAGLSLPAWGVYSSVHNLARPAVFLVGKGGAIWFRYISDSPADRPDIKTLLATIDRAAKPE